MKRTSKGISIILSVIMLMQMMTGLVFASGKTKLGTPTNIRCAQDENEEDVTNYQFSVNLPSGLDKNSVTYEMCIGGYVQGKAVLTNFLGNATEPEFDIWNNDVNDAFNDWKEEYEVSRSAVLFGFYVKSLNGGYSDSDMVITDTKGVIQNISGGIGGKCSGGACWTFSNGTLTFFGNGTADKPAFDVNEDDVETIIFESGVTAFDELMGFYNFPSLKYIYINNDNFSTENSIFRDSSHYIVVFAPKNSTVHNAIEGTYDSDFKFMDIETGSENYRTAPSYVNQVKIMSDCNIIPQIYSKLDEYVTKTDFAKAMVASKQAGLYIKEDDARYSDLTVGTYENGCANYAVDCGWITPKSETEFGVNDALTYGEIQSAIIKECILQDEEFLKLNITANGLESNDKITYEEFAALLYKAGTLRDNTEDGGYTFEIYPMGSLFEGSISTALEDGEWIATLNGVIKNHVRSSDSETITDKKYKIYDTELFGIEDDDIKLCVNGYVDIVSGIYTTYDIVKDGKVYRADFTINDGAAETNSKTVSLKLNAEGYTKYSIGGGSYKTITSSPISYTLDSKHGEQSVSVTFANDDLSKTKTVVKTIKLNNLHKVIYMADGKEFAAVLVGCGLEVPALDKTPAKEGYAFDGWENLPEIMPDKDITVNAKFVVEPPVASGTFNANDKAKWSLSKDGTLYISGTGSASVAGENANDLAFNVLEYITDREKAGMIKKIVVGEGITDIGDYVLYELYNAEKITLPSTLKTIGKAFMKGSSVKNVVIPANVASVNMDWSFIKCENLESVYFLNKDIALNIPDESSSYQRGINLYGYSDSSVKAYAETHNCTFISIDPDFAINNGAAETTDKNVKISFNDYAKNDFKQYKINDGEYKNIDGNDIDFVLDSADGEKTISITFKNDNYEIEKSHKIIFNNKHKITYVSGDVIIDEATVGCGAKITATDKIASKEGYTFLGWDIPEIMPDSDVAANAIFAKNADSEQLDAILSDEEKADGISVKADISAAEENANIQTELINKYSKYTASLIINIDISKGKNENFTPITETENLLTFAVDIPSEIQGKAEYIVLREHNGAVDALTTSKNADGEYIEVKDNTIIIHAKKFSAYQLIAKDADPTPSRRGGGGGGSSSLTVKFETNGAPTIKSVSVRRNNVITAPTAPVKDGFVFDGWYTDKNFATKFDFNTKITKSITLYAKWVEKAKTSIILTIGQKDATIDGKTVSNDVAPKIVNDRTMLPIRFIAEALGAKVDWIEESQTVKITAENIDISLVIGEDFATVNGEKIDLDSPSFIENDRTYLPIRFVSEKLGADVKWDDATQTVNITK